jgi:hypothetical protein
MIWSPSTTGSQCSIPMTFLKPSDAGPADEQGVSVCGDADPNVV